MRITTHWASFFTSPASTISDGDSPTPEPEKPEEPVRPERTANPGTSGKSCESGSECGTLEACKESHTFLEGELLGIKRCMVENERPKGCSYSGPIDTEKPSATETVFALGLEAAMISLYAIAKRFGLRPPSK